MQKIKVVILEDSLFYREAISKQLQQDINIVVVGKASNPYAARDMIVEYLPDLLIADVNLGKMSGNDFIEQLLPQYYLPVIMISSDANERAASLSHNVIDFIPKDSADFFCRLLVKIREAILTEKPLLSFSQLTSSVIAIGASTGGTDAIETLIRMSPAIVPSIVVSQHMSAGFTASFAERLNRKYKLSTKEAVDGDQLIPGQVYIAPGNFDMMIIRKNKALTIRVLPPPSDRKAHPNVDVLFQSVAQSQAAAAVGILLTGMGKDGASGLQMMHQAGYKTIVQDQKTSVVYGMPRAAKELGAADYQLPLPQIVNRCLVLLKQQSIANNPKD